MDRVVYECFFEQRGFVLTQLVSFRFSIQGILTTDPWPRADPLGAVYKFRRIITDATGTNPVYWNWKEQYNMTVNDG